MEKYLYSFNETLRIYLRNRGSVSFLLGLEKYQSIEKRKDKKDVNNEFINLPIDWKKD
jgi:hypothetical protein